KISPARIVNDTWSTAVIFPKRLTRSRTSTTSRAASAVIGWSWQGGLDQRFGGQPRLERAAGAREDQLHAEHDVRLLFLGERRARRELRLGRDAHDTARERLRDAHRAHF